MEKQLLENLIKEGKSTYKIAVEFGVIANTIDYWINKHDLRELYRQNSKRRRLLINIDLLPIEETKKIISDSFSIKEVLIKINDPIKLMDYRNFNKFINKYKINIKHFKPYETVISKLMEINLEKKIPLELILTENSSYNRTHLKNRLYKAGLKERKCELCGQGEEWHGRHMSLILDHINGIPNDNRLENLRIVCANCNATLDTHCSKNYKNKKIKLSKEEKRKNVINSAIKKRKVERPDLSILFKEIEELGYRGTGKKYGVSDNAIRNWIKYSHVV